MNDNTKKYCKKVYSKEVIIKAIYDYGKLADVKLLSSGNYYVCTFSGSALPLTRVINEFDNYLIELLNSPEAIV